MLAAAAHDPLLVAVGEIGLTSLCRSLDAERQQFFYAAQLKAGRQARSAGDPACGGAATSSWPLDCGARGWWAALRTPSTAAGSRRRRSGPGLCARLWRRDDVERALQIRRLAAELPAAIVLETDAPDIPPQWLYLTAEQRAARARSRNEPAELPRIAETLASVARLDLG